MDNKTLYGDTTSVTYREIAQFLDQVITPSLAGSGYVENIKNRIKLYEDGVITLRDLVIAIHDYTDTVIMDVIAAEYRVF